MAFVDDYKDRGGRVAVGDDAGFIFKLFGFAYVRELELLQEAGLPPWERQRVLVVHHDDQVIAVMAPSLANWLACAEGWSGLSEA